MISQSQQIKMQQKLTPQQIMLMNLLQTPAMLMEQTIKEEIEKNPLLEDDVDTTDHVDDYTNETVSDEYSNLEPYNDFDFEEYMYDDEPSYKEALEYDKDQDRDAMIPFAAEASFQEQILEQLNLKDITEEQQIIGMELIGNIDSAGYITRSIDAIAYDITFTSGIEVSTHDVEEVLRIVQSLEPAGIGARNLQECLSIQLHRIEEESRSKALATIIIDKHFESFTKKHYDKIMARMKLPESDLKSALELIFKLNPKPGTQYEIETEPTQYVVPDFFVSQSNGELSFTLNVNYPSLKISKHYTGILKEILANPNPTKSQRETATFIKDNTESARWFIDALRQRQQTLEKVMRIILNYQKNFFLTGDKNYLRPMLLKDIVEKTGYDLSTVSLIINQKYVQTNFGTFVLKDLFSKSYVADNGEEVSLVAIKNLLLELVEAEDKQNPLSDEKLVKIFSEKGFTLSRRTITKYREILKLPSARLRKELKG